MELINDTKIFHDLEIKPRSLIRGIVDYEYRCASYHLTIEFDFIMYNQIMEHLIHGN